jgi:hypothetical protein
MSPTDRGLRFAGVVPFTTAFNGFVVKISLISAIQSSYTMECVWHQVFSRYSLTQF